MVLPTCTDYINIIDIPNLIRIRELKDGYCERTHQGKIKRYSGGFCIVFPFIVGANKYAIRCWHAYVNKIQERTKIVSDYLTSCQLSYFVDFRYYSDGIVTSCGLMPIVVMDWIQAIPIKEYIKSKLHDANALTQLAKNFYDMTVDLHNHNISHGDLQHGNILVTEEGGLKLVDYDSMYVPGLENFEDEIKGLKGYQHPSRWKNKNATPIADYFSELIIYTSITALSKKPQLWNNSQMEESECMLFSEEDIATPSTSKILAEICSDIELEPLGNRIKEFIGLKSINDLLPLELAIIPPKQIDEKLADAWKTNGYNSKFAIISNPENIREKWGKSPSLSNVNYENLADKILKKW